MSFRVFVTSGAAEDVRDILRWLDERSAAGAETWFLRWQGVLGSLADQAMQYGEAPESREHQEAIRQLVFKTRRGRPYRALFVVRNRDVYILHVRGPGQNLLKPDEVRSPD